MKAADPGSFRDPSSQVVHDDGRIFRVLNRVAEERYLHAKSSGAYDALIAKNWLLPAEPPTECPFGDETCLVLEQPRLPFVSYPYEWPFGLLKKAALLHLDLHLCALEHGVTLSDGSAYNVQFLGPRPVFIDISSLRPYVEGEYWTAQHQFTEQFLTPLLVRSLFGVPVNSWYRGALEGIPLVDFNQLLRWHQKLSLDTQLFVTLPARAQEAAVSRERVSKVNRRKLPKVALQSILRRLRRWIARLQPKEGAVTAWERYEESHSYGHEEEAAKKRFISEFVAASAPETVWDLGCNTGVYSEVALKAGAKRVIGFDTDHKALERALLRAERSALDLLPLHSDLANPSPNQGWNELERRGLGARSGADMVLALALEHHLAIGRNIPLPQLVSSLVRLAPRGILEFVPKSDPMIERMLAFRDDIFVDYTEPVFEDLLASSARIVRRETVSGTGRILYAYERG